MLIRTSQHDADWLDRFLKAVQSRPEVIEAHRLAGDIDYILKVRVPNARAYDAFYRALIKEVSIFNVTSALSMEEIKNTTALPIPAEPGRRVNRDRAPRRPRISRCNGVRLTGSLRRLQLRHGPPTAACSALAPGLHTALKPGEQSPRANTRAATIKTCAHLRARFGGKGRRAAPVASAGVAKSRDGARGPSSSALRA